MANVNSIITQGNNDRVEIKSQVNLGGQAYRTFKQFLESFEPVIQAVKIEQINIGGDGGVYDNKAFGIYGVARYASTNTTSFVLGNSQAAILGTTKLGFSNSESIVVRVIPPNNKFIERFIGSVFIDPASTGNISGGTYIL